VVSGCIRNRSPRIAPISAVALSNSAERKPSCMKTSTQANMTPAMAEAKRAFSDRSCRQASRTASSVPMP
jgi:hypothetical protein